MSMPSSGAVQAPPIPRPGRRGSTIVRVGLGAVAVATVMSIPQVSAPAPVEAGSSCTGWTSEQVPPRTIKVLRTSTGRVQKVDFRRYVAEVMASGEWPSRLRRATLEAGAVVTKQYAWYYAMKGHHRPGFQSNGRCFDVRDDVQDQLFRPEKARPTAKQQRAVETTWGLALRKRGRFFLTGYRAGASAACAADANGWKLYAQSVEACATKGWSHQRILKAYLGPKLSFQRSAKAGPVVKTPVIRLTSGNTMPDDAATVAWVPVPTKGGIGRYTLQRRVGNGAWKDIPLAKAKARSAKVWLKNGVNNRFRIRATDAAGRTGPWSYSATRKAAIRGPVGRRLGGSRYLSTRRQAGKVQSRVRGRSIAVVTRTGPGMGKARILVDGKRVATVNLDRKRSTSRELIWARNFDGVRRHRVSVRAGSRDARVDFKGFYVLR